VRCNFGEALLVERDVDKLNKKVVHSHELKISLTIKRMQGLLSLHPFLFSFVNRHDP
jgi:hypothetical protein